VPAIPGPDSAAPGRTPYLDGLRGLAILSVISLHYFFIPFHLTESNGWYLPLHHLLGAAWAGVDLFFVLSGFLLGGTLLDHRGAPNFFPVFYLRRACRILPAYLLFLSPLLLVPLLGLDRRMPTLQAMLNTGDVPAWTYPLFVQNFAMTFNGTWGETWIATTWSLAVEQQFYLILPFLIRFVPSRRLPFVLVSLGLIAPTLRMGLQAWAPFPYDQIGSYTLLPCRFDALLLGVLAAWAVRDPGALAWLRGHGQGLRRLGHLLALTALALAWRSPYLNSVAMRTVGYTVFALLFSTTILCGHLGILRDRRLLEWSPLRWIGRISYTLFLVHLGICSLVFYFGAHSTRNLRSPLDLLLMLTSFAVAVTCAALSWKILEKPFIDFSQRFRYRPPAAPPVLS
jgi:peptidoglycan/LPS O-acetylase OafA/YrhL